MNLYLIVFSSEINKKEQVYENHKELFVELEKYFTLYLVNLKSASNLNGNLNCSKELEHYAS